MLLRFFTSALILVSFLHKGTSCPGKQIINAGITEIDKQLILEMHNKMRQNLALGHIRGQPPAANMQEMKWDDELAYKAQNWAVSCSSEKHDERRHISRFPVGQNIATRWTTRSPRNYYDTAPDFADAIRRWFNEVNTYHYDQVRRSTRVTGHYTQMIWANTNLIGCGFSFYYDASKGFVKNYVCNYGPGGNVITRTPYEKGHPSCSHYGMHDSLKYLGLCETGIQNFGTSQHILQIHSNFVGR